MTVLDDIRAKYAKVVKTTDKYGRILSVRRLNVSQRTDVKKWAQSSDIEVVATFTFAAAVCAVNDNPYVFPKSEAEVKAVADMLDDDGILAVAKAYEQLVTESAKETIDAAKNLPATENSGSA